MDIEQSFEILELDRGASTDEIKQSYKDIVTVWHPDRFSNNPRLKQKAEEKLKEVNAAYDTLKSYLSSEQRMEPKQENAQPDVAPYDKTEAVVEAGTGIALSLWSYLSSLFQSVVTDVKTGMEQGRLDQSQRGAGYGGRGRRKDKGMGRRGGGRGKGRG
ncbi:MAG: J domain-containing protein [Deltaproteobacteria bacterium]|jgi:DnaJ-class molecular chaperone|nr:J domain-containing protein [Deltaproteobacteria bacterium]MDL1986447.1 J domain-containing protein [Deltaproteobacteria bacterium]